MGTELAEKMQENGYGELLSANACENGMSYTIHNEWNHVPEIEAYGASSCNEQYVGDIYANSYTSETVGDVSDKYGQLTMGSDGVMTATVQDEELAQALKW